MTTKFGRQLATPGKIRPSLSWAMTTRMGTCTQKYYTIGACYCRIGSYHYEVTSQFEHIGNSRTSV